MTNARTATFNIPAGVKVYGGFAGTETSLGDRDLIAGNKTTLSGDIGTAIATLGDFADAGYNDNSYHVVSMVGADAVLDGFTVEAGRADDGLAANNNEDRGGGIYVRVAVSLLNLEVRYNYANRSGGGIFILNSSSGKLTATNCTAYDNEAGVHGGGMHLHNASSGEIIATNCMAYGNQANAGGGMNLYNTSSEAITAVNCTSYNNESTTTGGGMRLGNTSSGTITAVNCTSYDNQAGTYGGGMNVWNSSTGEETVANCTIYGNQANNGGGMNLWNSSSGELTVANGIIYDNTASGSGADVYNNLSKLKTLLSHSLLGSAVAGESTVGTDYTLTAPVSGNPRFASTIAGEADFLRLQENSPAVDAGNNSLLPDGITTDLAGNNRIQDGDEDNTATVDLGAYEGTIEVFPLYVDAGVVGGAGDGSSWANAYASLTDALAEVGDGDSLFVKAGTYTPSTVGLTNARTATFNIPEGVKVYGGFAGTETSLGDRALIAGNETTLSGDIGTAIATLGDFDDAGYADNVFHVVSMEGANAVLDGFTVEAGRADDGLPANNSEDIGGGIYVVATSTTLRNLEVRYNYADRVGGGMRLGNFSTGEITIANCTIYNNEANDNGGGMFLVNKSSGEFTIANCTFYDNQATSNAGGMFLLNDGSGEITATNCTFYDNQATYGGSIYLDIRFLGGEFTIANCTFYDNQASYGGGMYLRNSSTGKVTAVNCTIYDNEVTSDGGGMFLRNVSSGEMIVANSIIYANTASGEGADVYNLLSKPKTLLSHCLLGSEVAGESTAGTDFTLTAPVLGNPRFASTTAGNDNFLRLQGRSPAVDAGNNSLVPDGITTDLAGNNRIQNADGDNTVTVDLGAYERTVGVATIYVDAAVSGGADDGSSWANAYASLSYALAGANANDSIFVKAGTYKPTSGTSRTATFNISAGVSVYGGFAGTESSLAERDLSAGNETILSGDLGVAITTLGDFDDAGYADNVYHVVTMEGDNAVLDGFTVEGGNADDGLGSWNSEDFGGGIYVDATSTTLRNLALRYNQANQRGGGMYLYNTSSGDIIATNCVAYDNQSNAAGGGGMFLLNTSSGDIIATNCTAYGNEVAVNGGGMHLRNEGTGDIIATNCTAYDNEAVDHGGGMNLRNEGTGDITATNCVAYGNEVSGHGGGMNFAHASTGEITATNCTIYDNQANNGGGMNFYNASSGDITVANCISYINNSADNAGADVYNESSSTNTLLSHCLLGTAVAGNATAGTDYTLTAPVSGNPRFASTIAGEADFLRLQENSPAVDAGNNSLVPEGVTTDLAGNNRIQDGDEDGTATVDLGAYEGTIEVYPLYVDAGVVGGAGDGSSWANAYASLSAALTAAGDGDSVFVKAGAYKPSTVGLTNARTATFNIPEGVKVYGGFAGTETSLGDRDLSAGNETILSGDIGTAVGADPTNLDDAGYDDNVYHVVSMEGANAVLDGFTVEAGRADDGLPANNSEDDGGGIYATTAITLRNLEVRYNQANRFGGGMNLYNGTSGEVTIANCTIYDNEAYNGGGMRLRNFSSGEITATNCTSYNNEAINNGGGIYLYNDGSGEVIATNCTSYNNEAGDDGGGMFLYNASSGDITATNCTSYDNEAVESGGGMILWNETSSTGDITATNCTAYDNEAYNGGGMILWNRFSGKVTAVNCTIYNNEATNDGGGMLLQNDLTGELTVANGIIYNNTASGEGTDAYNNSSRTNTLFSHCLLGSDVAGMATAGTDFTLTAPVSGDPLFTSTTAVETNFLRLQGSSPAVDAGNNDLVPDGITTDLAGNNRIQDGDGDNTATVNLGAYEGTVEAQTIHYVDAGVGGGADDGSSWANAYASLSAALAVAGDGEWIFVKAGTYKPTSGTSRSATFNIPAGVEVYGGFAGNEASLSARDLSAGHETILSGDLGTAITTLGDFTDAGYDDNSYHVVSMEDDNTILDGFTVQGGNADGSFFSDEHRGGGIYATAAGMLRNLTVRYNTSTGFGGGMYLYNESTGSLIVTNAKVYANEVSGGFGVDGGGMYLYNESTGSLIVTNATVYGNNANDDGGGMYLYNESTGTITVTNATVYANEATDNGGGMYLDNASTGPLTVTNATIYANEATDNGGGMYLNNSSSGLFTVTNSISFGNIASDGQDVYRSYSGTAATLANSLLGEAAAGGALTITNPVGTNDGNGNVLGDPLFASRNPNKGVFLRLTASSPALDAGDNSLVPAGVTTDLAGNARIQNTTVDVGAYEGVFVAPPASIYYVDVNVNGGSGDGSSWANAYTDLGRALSASASGDRLFVADGTYTPSSSSRLATFSIPTGVSVYGGFAGDEVNLAARDLSAGNETILSGDLGTAITTLGNFGDAGYSDNTYHVVSLFNAGATLDGFTVQGGNANSFSDNDGGGIYATGAHTLRNLTVRYNTASDEGGGMYLSNSSTGPLTVTNATVYGNNANDEGGGMYLSNSSTGPLTVTNATVYGNNANDEGGGMYLSNSSSGPLTVTNATIYDNEVSGRFGNGGGMYLNNSSSGLLTVANSISFGNIAIARNGPDAYRSTFGTAAILVNCLLGEAATGGTLTITNPVGTDDGNGNVLGDPLFASRNPNKAVFLRLTTSSPALDAGDNSRVPAGVTTDLAGNARIQNTTVDVGAYEGTFPLLPSQRYYVDVDASGENNGTSWVNAYTDLQDALRQAGPGDNLFVAGGIYTPTTGTSRAATFSLPREVSMYGGFAGDEANLAARDLSLGNETILSGDLGTAITTLGGFGDAGYADNSYHVVSMPNAGATLDGFTVQGGNANSFLNTRGGGIYATGANTLRNLTVRYNTASGEGGGMYLSNSSSGTLTVTNATVYANEAGSGGGMYLYNESSGPLTVTNATVYANEVSGGFGDGGGMYLYNGSSGLLTVANSISFGNAAGDEGPDVYRRTFGTSATLANCLLGEAAGGGTLNITHPVGIDDGNGNILGDPFFASRNPNKAAFLRLTVSSLALDAGDNSRVPNDVTTDLAGNARIQNTTVDVGAYEGAFPLLPPQRHYVDVNAFSGSNDGSSWVNAYTDLQDALRQAGPGDILFVAGGIYKPTAGTSRAATFSLPREVSMYGGFAGDEANLAARDLSAGNETILSGDLGTAIMTLGDFDDAGYDDNSYHVVSLFNAGATLDGFTVQGGNADGSSSNRNGGGIYATGANTLRNLTVRYNTASDDGGGMYLYNESTGPLIITNATVYANEVSGSFGEGGGMYLSNSSSGMLTVTNATIYANEISGSFGEGGGIYLWNSSSGMLTVTNATIYANEVSRSFGEGGGMYLWNSSSGMLTVTNATVYDNEASSGGGMYLWNGSSGPLTVVNSISFGNAAGDEGPDVYRYTFGTAATLDNCLLGEAATGGMLTITNPVGTDDGNGNILGDPLFASTTVGDADFLRLLENSPALDAGDNSLVPTGVTTDLAGNDRIQDGDEDNTATVDLGAYERTIEVSPVVPAQTIHYVDATVSGGNGDGSSWANAYASLTDALAAVNSGDSLFVKAGTYKPLTVGVVDSDGVAAPRLATFAIPAGVEVYGGFAGTETSLASRDLSAGNKTILSGDIGVAVGSDPTALDDAGYADNSYHVVYMEGADVVLDGFTVEGGSADDFTEPNNSGGGIYVGATSTTLRNLELRYNRALAGGSMYLDNTSSGEVTIANCTSYNNLALFFGGGMYLGNASSGDIIATNCTIYNNEALFFGGGMYLNNAGSGEITATNCAIYDNQAAISGAWFFRMLPQER